MKSESLHALLIDRQLGELSPEMVELLDAWQAEHPESAAAVSSIRRTVETTNAAVRRFPELARPQEEAFVLPATRVRLIPVALAASILILLSGTAWLGFRAGYESGAKIVMENRADPATAPPAMTVKNDGPWARYVIESNPRGGLTVIRRAPNHQP